MLAVLKLRWAICGSGDISIAIRKWVALRRGEYKETGFQNDRTTVSDVRKLSYVDIGLDLTASTGDS